MDPIEQSKKFAAYKAVDNHVKPEDRVSACPPDKITTGLIGLQVIGIGSGRIIYDRSASASDPRYKAPPSPMLWIGLCSKEKRLTRGASSFRLVCRSRHSYPILSTLFAQVSSRSNSSSRPD